MHGVHSILLNESRILIHLTNFKVVFLITTHYRYTAYSFFENSFFYLLRCNSEERLTCVGLRWVAEHLIIFGQVEHHNELVWPPFGIHFLSCGDRLDAKLPFCHVKRQLVVFSAVCLVQGVKVTGGTKRGRADHISEIVADQERESGKKYLIRWKCHSVKLRISASLANNNISQTTSHRMVWRLDELIYNFTVAFSFTSRRGCKIYGNFRNVKMTLWCHRQCKSWCKLDRVLFW